MKDRIQILKDFASTRDNFFLYNQLEILEAEINIEIMKAKTSVYKKINNDY
jgi:hypothetical protein